MLVISTTVCSICIEERDGSTARLGQASRRCHSFLEEFPDLLEIRGVRLNRFLILRLLFSEHFELGIGSFDAALEVRPLFLAIYIPGFELFFLGFDQLVENVWRDRDLLVLRVFGVAIAKLSPQTPDPDLLPSEFGPQALIIGAQVDTLIKRILPAHLQGVIASGDSDSMPDGYTRPERLLTGFGHVTVQVNWTIVGNAYDDGVGQDESEPPPCRQGFSAGRPCSTGCG